MIRRENILRRFTMGISVLTAYIDYMGSLNMHDINISSEQFLCDLLNIIYKADLKNANNINFNNHGYDLIDEDNKVIMQITSTDKPIKIMNTIKVVECDIQDRREKLFRLVDIKKIKEEDPTKYTRNLQEDRKNINNDLKKQKSVEGYTLYFFIMVKHAEVKKYKGENGKGYIVNENIKFDKDNNILDFTSLIKKVSSISEEPIGNYNDILESLEVFMNKNYSVFGTMEHECIDKKNRVETVIQEYSDNFTEKLFRHKYNTNSKVTLDKLFVEPKISAKGSDNMNVVKAIGNFLWNETEKRILFIEGDAAIGKTSVVSYLCYHYLNKDEICKAVFLQSDVVCVRLRELDFSDKNKKIDRIILDYLNIENIQNFRALFPDCILIMDGADEMSMIEGIHRGGLEDLIVAIRRTFRNNKIIITSRPQFIDTKVFENRSFGVETIKILHFDAEIRRKWMKKYEECGEKISETTKNYINNLDEEAAIGVADTPLALYILVACDMSSQLQNNIWALYHEIFNKAIINTEYNENFDNNLEHPIKEYEKLLYKIVCNIAFKMFKNSEEERYYITSYELDDIIEELGLDSEIIEGIKKCCVLCAYWKDNGREGALEFYHNNIRDYFFAEYIFDMLVSIMDNRCENKEECFLERMCNIMQYGRISHTTWEQTFLFIYKRIQYIGNHDERIKKFVCIFINIYKNIILKDTIWKFKYEGFYYQKLKNTLFNTLLLVRIFIRGTHSEEKCIRTTFWNSDEELIKIKNSNILSDLSKIFGERVAIGENEIISVGQNCVLDNLNFEKKNLSDMSFKGSQLNLVNFSNTYMENIDFSFCKMSNISFEGSTLVNINFFDTILDEINFCDCKILDCDFTKSDISHGNYQYARLENCKFNNCTIDNVDWMKVKVKGGKFDDVEIYNSKIKNLNLKNEIVHKLMFKYCKLYKINIENCEAGTWKFYDCTLEDGAIIKTELYNSIFKDIDFKNFRLNGSDIRHNEFSNINFEDSSFAQAKVYENIWDDIKLRNTDFRYTEIYTEDYKDLEGYNADLKWAVNK